jgi:hypothetical protein
MSIGKIFITELGYFLIVFFLLLYLLKKEFLPAFFVILSIFQAGSILNIEIINAGTRIYNLDYQVVSYGLNPFTFFAPVIFIYFLVNIKLVLGILRAEVVLKLILLFCIIGVFGAFLLPNLFESTPVYSPLERFAAEYPPAGLKFGISNFVQAVNLIINTVFIFYLFQQNLIDKNLKKIASAGFLIGFLFVVGVQFYERLAWIFNWASFDWLFLTNSGYALSKEATTQTGVLRIGMPFSEPSYAGAYIGSIFCATLSLIAFGHLKNHKSLICGFLFLTFISTLNIISSTGLVVVAVGLSIFSIYLTFKNSKFNRIIILSLILISLGVCTFFYNYNKSFEILVDEFILEKFIYAADRFKADYYSISLIVDTFGLGVGIGSNRPSSLFASLLSNVGVIGFLIHFVILLYTSKLFMSINNKKFGEVFYFWMFVFITFSMYLSIPDINLPIYWVIMGLAILFVSDTKKIREDN